MQIAIAFSSGVIAGGVLAFLFASAVIGETKKLTKELSDKVNAVAAAVKVK